MHIPGRFRRATARSAELPGPYLSGGHPGGVKSLHRSRNNGYTYLFIVVALLFFIAIVIFVSNGGGDANTNGNEANWMESPNVLPTLSAERKDAVREEIKRGATRQPPRLKNTDPLYTATSAQPTVAQTHLSAVPTAGADTTTATIPNYLKVTPVEGAQPEEQGVLQPQHPEQLPGLSVHHRTYTPDELMALFGNFTIVYTFVNGSEPNHFYRKRMLNDCMGEIMQKEQEWYREQAKFYKNGSATTSAGDQANLLDKRQSQQADDEAANEGVNEAEAVWSPSQCIPQFLRRKRLSTAGDLWQETNAASTGGADNRDRETDELRHSLRSVEQHMPWHKGRVVLVSPGHHPLWMDNAKTFLANKCGGEAIEAKAASGPYLRVITVHQDAIMPYGIKLTVNSHTIEQHLWRIKNITPVHVYYNDDYFVNRDVAITDLFNEYGGTIIRTEKGIIGPGKLADFSASWIKGVVHTTLFNIIELDKNPENFLPPALTALWKEVRQIVPSPAEGMVRHVPVPDLSELIDTAHFFPAEPLPNITLPNEKRRRFATHAPFVYCTNLFAFLETRYEREFASNSLAHRRRKARDLFLPFVYNAFVMSRPWQASPKFLPYLLGQRAGSQGGDGDAAKTDIYLDNFDGCAPASMRSGAPASACTFAKFVDDMAQNERAINAIMKSNPLYFNINTGATTVAARKQLYDYLEEKFPTPIYLERGFAPISEEDRALPQLYGDLMKLPVIAVTSFEEGVCPMVRSLQLALPDHTGYVVTAVAAGPNSGVSESGHELGKLRTLFHHRVRSAMLVPACTFNERVPARRTASTIPTQAGEDWRPRVLTSIVSSALSELQANGTSAAAVPIPSVCGVAGGDGGDVRICAIVLDGRSDVTDALSLRHAVTMPGQTLALEDFDVVPLADGSGDSVLVLARSASDAKAVHWIDGASASDLLLTYPIPYADYEDLSAALDLF